MARVLFRDTNNAVNIDTVDELYALINEDISKKSGYEFYAVTGNIRVRVKTNSAASISTYASGSTTPTEDMIVSYADHGCNVDIITPEMPETNKFFTVYPNDDDSVLVNTFPVFWKGNVPETKRCVIEALARAYWHCVSEGIHDEKILTSLEREFLMYTRFDPLQISGCNTGFKLYDPRIWVSLKKENLAAVARQSGTAIRTKILQDAIVFLSKRAQANDA